MNNTKDLGELAFYWRTRKTLRNSPNIVPDFLPLTISFEPSLQLIRHVPNEAMSQYLKAIYEAEYNIGYMQIGHDLAECYANDLLMFLDRATTSGGFLGRSALELGCGGCFILRAMKNKGFEVFGIDPSPISVKLGPSSGLDIRTGFFPQTNPGKKVDFIYHANVLEHLADPVTFLRQHHEFLSDNGRIAISVPDCSENIQGGDLSMLIHQHLSFFDEESLRLTVEAAGFRVLGIERSHFASSLYCYAEKNPSPVKVIERDYKKFEDYCQKLETSISRLKTHIEPILRDSSKSLGIYVPLRSLPYLSRLKLFNGMRFFDDDPGIYGHFCDGFDMPIENIADLKRKPTTHLFVASLSFEEPIIKKVRETIGKNIEIFTLKDLLSQKNL